jgi:hypothetical protein
MQSKEACDNNDHDHYADDVKNTHCIAPIEAALQVFRAAGCAPTRTMRHAQNLRGYCVAEFAICWT